MHERSLPTLAIMLSLTEAKHCLIVHHMFLRPRPIIGSLNSFTDPSKAGKAVEDCIEKSKKENAIPKSLRKATPLFLGATAGMRLVR